MDMSFRVLKPAVDVGSPITGAYLAEVARLEKITSTGTGGEGTGKPPQFRLKCSTLLAMPDAFVRPRSKDQHRHQRIRNHAQHVAKGKGAPVGAAPVSCAG